MGGHTCLVRRGRAAMDNAEPLSIVLHFDYAPYNERLDEGWEPDDVIAELRDIIARLTRNTSGLALIDIEPMESRTSQRDA